MSIDVKSQADQAIQRMTIEQALDLVRETDAEGIEPTKAFIEGVREHGVIEPVVVTMRDDRPVLVDGIRRIKAAHAVGQATVPYVVQIVDHVTVHGKDYGDEIGRALLTILLNEQRSSNPVVELRELEKLAKVVPEEDLPTVTRMSRNRIRRRMRLTRLIPALREKFESGEMRIGAAEAAARLSPVAQTRVAEADRPTARAVRLAKQAQRSDALAQLPANLFGDDKGEADPVAALHRALHGMTSVVASLLEGDAVGDLVKAARDLRENIQRRSTHDGSSTTTHD